MTDNLPAATHRQVAARGYEFERAIGNLIEASRLQRIEGVRAPVDFAVMDSDGRRIAIDTKLSSRIPMMIAEQWIERAKVFDALFIVSLEDPPDRLRSRVTELARGAGIDFEWMSAGTFQEWLGLPVRDLTSTIQQIELAREAILASIPGGNDPIAPELLVLREQLPPRTLEIAASQPDLRAYLKIGERLAGRTVLLSDLANYSTLVGKAPPEELSAAMGRYYRLSREAVFDHDGTLAKFVGDSVVAIFDYPEQAPDSTKRAVMCASDLAAIGRDVLKELVESISIDVSTGTRIGIANGEIVVVDSGRELPLGEFVSDPINRAARLQAAAPLDGALMDRRAMVALRNDDETFLRSLSLRPLDEPIGADQAKGQLGPVPVWEISAETLESVHNTHNHKPAQT